MVKRLFLAVQRGCLQFVIVVFPDHTHLLFLNTKLLKQGYLYQKLCKGFYKFYHRPSELIVKYNVGLKTLLQQGTLEPVRCGDLAYKFTKSLESLLFMISFKRSSSIIKMGYNMDIMQQSACLIIKRTAMITSLITSSDSIITMTLIFNSLSEGGGGGADICLRLAPP